MPCNSHIAHIGHKAVLGGVRGFDSGEVPAWKGECGSVPGGVCFALGRVPRLGAVCLRIVLGGAGGVHDGLEGVRVRQVLSHRPTPPAILHKNPTYKINKYPKCIDTIIAKQMYQPIFSSTPCGFANSQRLFDPLWLHFDVFFAKNT